VRLDIVDLGVQGDGIASWESRRVIVPFTLPGDVVEADLDEIPESEPRRARLRRVLEPAPSRIAPICPHFGTCGGCQLQHQEMQAYLAWKRERVIAALRGAGLVEIPVEPVLPTPPGERRRARLGFRLIDGTPRLGFAERGTHRPVDIRSCAILRPELVALLPRLRESAELRGLGPCAIELTLTLTGLDALIETPNSLSPPMRTRLAALAESLDLARLSTRENGAIEPIAWRRTPELEFSGVPVTPPPGGFVQTSAAAERELVRLARSAIGEARRIADLFSGCGTFTFALASAGRSRSILAVEGDAPALASLDAAARRAGLSGRVRMIRRNLEKEPMSPPELRDRDAVLFDPPRAGARAQAAMLAASAVPVVVAVSCDPASFARDAALLAAGGYRLERVSPVDQFLWTGHVELIAVFRRR